MAWNEPSEWNRTVNPSGLTDKQQDMEGSRYPGANAPSQPKPQEDGKVVTGSESAQQGQQKQQQEQQKQQQAAQDQSNQQVAAQVNQISSRIGSFGFLLKGKVNNFLQQSTQSGFNPGESAVQYDNETGKMKITDSMQASSAPAVQEKQALQGQLKSTLSPFAEEVAGTLQGKSFSKVLSDLAKTDPLMAKQLPQLMQINSMLDQLEAQGAADTPEAQSLRQQLKQMDSLGIVSGMKDAKDKYEQLMGLSDKPLTYSGGDSTKKFSALDLASLGTEDLRKEVEKGIAEGSGLFGGDTNENLQRLYDTESAEIAKSNRQREELHSQLVEGLTSYAAEKGEDFQAAREHIDTMFKDAASSIAKKLDESGNGQAAKVWLEAIKGGNIEKVMMDALNNPNSGLSREQRQAIANFIGEAGRTGGELNAWINGLRTSGKIPVKLSDGNTAFTELSPGQSAEMLRIMSDPNIQDKEAAIRPIIERSVVVDPKGGPTTIGQLVQGALTAATTTGNTTAAVNGFRESMVNSLMTYAKSRTEDIVRKAMGIPDDKWATMNPEERTAAVTAAIQANPDLAKKLKEDVAIKSGEDKVNMQAHIDTFNKKAKEAAASAAKFATFDKDGNLNGGQYFEQMKVLNNTLPTMASSVLNRIVESTGSAQYKKYYDAVNRNPSVQQARAAGMQVDPALIAKAMMYYDSAKDMARYTPTFADTIYGGAAYDLTINPMEFVQNGDMATLKKIVDASEKAKQQVFSYQNAQSHANESLITKELQKLAGGNTPMGAAIATRLKEADAMKKQLQDQIEKAKNYTSDLTNASATMSDLAKNISSYTFDPDEVINVALGGAHQMESTGGYDAGAIKAENDKLPPESIQTINGVPYLKMGDGSYRPVGPDDINKALGATRTFGGAGIGSLDSFKAPLDMGTSIRPDESVGRLGINVPSPAAAGAGTQDTLHGNKNVEPGKPGVGNIDTYTWHANDGTTGQINVPKGVDPKVYMAQKYPGLDTGTVGFETVSPLERMGQDISSGWDSVVEALTPEAKEESTTTVNPGFTIGGQRFPSTRTTITGKPDKKTETKESGGGGESGGRGASPAVRSSRSTKDNSETR